jgi:hypothetical protein
MNTSLYFYEACIFKKFFKFCLLKIVNTDTVMLDIKIILQLSIPLIGHVDLPEIIAAVVSEKET